jgi:hypothetical protein
VRRLSEPNGFHQAASGKRPKESRLHAAIASAMGKVPLINLQATQLKRFERLNFRETAASGTLRAGNRPFGILAPRERN